MRLIDKSFSREIPTAQIELGTPPLHSTLSSAANPNYDHRCHTNQPVKRNA